MNELVELRFNDNRILLKENHVRSPILPQVAAELERDVVIQGDCVIDGAMFARNLEIQQGPFRARGAIFAQMELHVNSDARGDIFFEKVVGASSAIVSLAPGCRLHFLSDVTAKQIKLRNAYVSGSVFGDEITLEDCVILGGVFASRSLELTNCIAGTFNSPSVRASQSVYILFPSAFSIEMVNALPGTQFYNLTLADLGALMRGTEPLANTGKIAINWSEDGLKAVLTGDGTQQIVRAYSVVGKVLAADLVDYDKLQNHFLITCASLGNQLLRTYDLGLDKNGNPVPLTPERVASFFFDILDGKITVPDLRGDFDIGSIIRGETPTPHRGNGASASPSLGVTSDTPDSPAAADPEPEVAGELPGSDNEIPQDPPPEAAAIGSRPDAFGGDGPEVQLCQSCNLPLAEGDSFCGECGRPTT